ncbi:unnamed protein product, partial [Rotaria magnacalcarata]
FCFNNLNNNSLSTT